MHSYSYSLTRSEMNARRVNAECRETGTRRRTVDEDEDRTVDEGSGGIPGDKILDSPSHRPPKSIRTSKANYCS